MARRVEEFRLSHAPAALICSVMAEMKRDPQRRSQPFSASEFMPGEQAEPGEKQVDDTQATVAMLERLNAAFGGQDLRGQ